MYAPIMWKRLLCLPAVVLAGWSLASCDRTVRKAAAPTPESDQKIQESLKELYMAASAAAPQSPEQHKVILEMAQRASSGRELLLTMRAAVGVFPSNPAEQSVEGQVRSLVTGKMIQVATLEQLIDFAGQYSVDPSRGREFVQRMFDLANGSSDARVWYRIKTAAYRLKVDDLQRQAQSKGDELASR